MANNNVFYNSRNKFNNNNNNNFYNAKPYYYVPRLVVVLTKTPNRRLPSVSNMARNVFGPNHEIIYTNLRGIKNALGKRRANLIYFHNSVPMTTSRNTANRLMNTLKKYTKNNAFLFGYPVLTTRVNKVNNSGTRRLGRYKKA